MRKGEKVPFVPVKSPSNESIFLYEILSIKPIPALLTAVSLNPECFSYAYPANGNAKTLRSELSLNQAFENNLSHKALCSLNAIMLTESGKIYGRIELW